MLIGYARVSSDDQNLNLQKDALTRAGCERILEDRQSGAKADRAGLRDALDYARNGDTLTVWRLDRLSRSLKDLIDLVSQLEARGIGLKSLHESIDTTSSSGKLIFHVFGALAEFERNLIRERTQAGLAAARARGRRGGRPKSLDAAKRAIAVNLYDEKKHSVKEICEVMGVSNPHSINTSKQRALKRLEPGVVPGSSTQGLSFEEIRVVGSRSQELPVRVQRGHPTQGHPERSLEDRRCGSWRHESPTHTASSGCRRI